MRTSELNFPPVVVSSADGGPQPRPARRALRDAQRVLRRRRAEFDVVRAENGVLAAAEFAALCALGLRRKRRLRVAGLMLTLRTATPDVIVARDTLTREFEPLVRLVDRAQDGLVVDAGGYIGTATLRLAQMFPNARIVVVEPCRENFAILSENLRGVPNVVALNAALSADAAGGRLALFDRGTGDVGFTIVARPDDAVAAARMYEVDALTIGEIMRRFDADEIALMKMDIEGAERDLLVRADDWLDDVGVLMIELHERIVGGCDRAFIDATEGRVNRRFGGEKHVSFRRPRAAMAMAAE